MATGPEPQLYLRFHGRILDSLGIQMYQSPVAAVAELIANAWDADAQSVTVTLPDRLDGAVELVVEDDGLGMTFEECQNFYLNVGRNRRADGAVSSPSGRPVLGRKGIGKFAGFGIADVMHVETVSGMTGERTVFELDIRELRSDTYVDVTPRPVTMIEHDGADPARIPEQGTTIRLRQLKLRTVRNPETFAKHMARRFNLASQSTGFTVTVNDVLIPEDVEPFPVQSISRAITRRTNDLTASPSAEDGAQRHWRTATRSAGGSGSRTRRSTPRSSAASRSSAE